MSPQATNTVTVSPDEIVLELHDVRPISLQGTSGNKAALTQVLAEMLVDIDRIVLSDVRVTIEWILHEDERYLGTSSPDVDNIIKPILDAMSGPAGIVANDYQAQSVQAYWIDGPVHGPHRLTIRVQAMPIDFYPRAGIYWVAWPDGYCWPLWSTLPPEAGQRMLQGLDEMLCSFNEAVASGIDPAQANLFMPQVRRFGRGRLKGFDVVELDEALGALGAGVHAAGQSA